jgi:hypothetical protein
VIRGLPVPLVFQVGGRDRATQTLREAIDTRSRTIGGEHYFPIQSPPPFHYVPAGRDFPPEALAGLWCGSYGPHGQEFGYICVREADSRVYHADEVDLEKIESADPAEVLRRGSSRGTRRIIEWVKITGDGALSVAFASELTSEQPTSLRAKCRGLLCCPARTWICPYPRSRPRRSRNGGMPTSAWFRFWRLPSKRLV